MENDFKPARFIEFDAKEKWIVTAILSLFSKALIHLYFEQLDGDGGSWNEKYKKCWNTSVFNSFSAPVLKPDPQFDPKWEKN